MIIDFVLSKRPLVVVLTLVLLMAGVFASKILPLEAYPDIANLQVRVITQIPGKAAEEMERLVTIPLEKELTGIPHAEPPRSITIFGLSVITIVFDDNVSAYVARQQVMEKVAHADLPPGVSPQLDPDASPVGEVYRYVVEGQKWSPMAQKEWQDWFLTKKFKSVPGIVDVTGFGGPTKVFQVEIDPFRLHARGVSLAQLTDAIATSTGSTGGSYIVQNGQDYMVRGMGLLHTTEDIKNVVVDAKADGVPVLVKDLGDVKIGSRVRLGQVGMNDNDDVVEGIILMRRGENPSYVVDRLMETWVDIENSLPPGMHLTPLYDRTALVRKTMDTIEHNVAEGIVLVVTMMMLYLFQVRSALICACVIPLALSFALVCLNLFGIPGNLLSLGAIDFGILVDGAIVMVENIIRYLHDNKSDLNKDNIVGYVGTAAKEVLKPVLFATSIIIVTFLPILTFQRVEGKLFRPLAITMNLHLIGAVIASMTIIPVLCAVVFKMRLPSDRHSPILDWAERKYKPILLWTMENKFKVLQIILVFFAITAMLIPGIGGEFIPELEEGNIWLRITVLPTSVALEKSIDIAHEARILLKKYPEVTNVVTQIGAPDDGTDPNNYSNIETFIDLQPQDNWRPQFKNKQALIEDMEKNMTTAMPGNLYNFSQYIKDNMDEAIAGVKGEIGVKIYGYDLKVLSKIANHVRKIIENVPGMKDVACDYVLGQPQLLISIDRDKAARYAINSNDILDIVETAIGGKAIAQLYEGERRFDVMIRYKKNYRLEFSSLANILVTSPSGIKIPLSQLATITEDQGATEIFREKNQRRVAIKANIRNRDLMSTVLEAQKLVKQKINLPPGYKLTWEGQFERASHAMLGLAIIIPLTLGLIFVLLYIATGCSRIALLVMTTVPLAVPGAVFALWVTRTHFSISAGIGLISLFGVSIQNGVILVSLVRQFIDQGMTIKNAVIQSTLIRVKPALMTSTVAMAGLIPAAISTGIGSQSQRPIAIIISIGLLPSILLSLIVLPTLYELVERKFGNKKYVNENKLEALNLIK